jgi:peptidoglycan/LPS O-acetylase OafA/YrhL
MKYRADIDGLRAIAVLAVVLFHADFALFGGGFIGVDVFFVISGYLITSIIATEIKEGRFSLVGFYERRARRILPALFTVILASFAVAPFALSPGRFAEFVESAVAVTLFSANFLFWQQSGYFGGGRTVLHLLPPGPAVGRPVCRRALALLHHRGRRDFVRGQQLGGDL